MEETYYLVEYHDSYGDNTNEGVFTKNSWNKYIKGLNKDREQEGEMLFMESMDRNIEFIFTEIRVYN
tara:strand:+ start:3728 stop:3928 length:201 start_codon:yes stop_codon:yes gene_type:complete